jgi:hypothetical protein
MQQTRMHEHVGDERPRLSKRRPWRELKCLYDLGGGKQGQTQQQYYRVGDNKPGDPGCNTV